MSRIGKQPVAVRANVKVALDGSAIRVEGPMGVLNRVLPLEVSVVAGDGSLQIERKDDSRTARAMHGLSRTLVANMVAGVTGGFTKNLDIVGVGYRAQAKSPSQLELSLGFSHQVIVEAPAGIGFETPTPTRIVVKGIDKELVGQVAANIRKIRKPEPYKGKGVRYEGERVRRKVGKAGK